MIFLTNMLFLKEYQLRLKIPFKFACLNDLKRVGVAGEFREDPGICVNRTRDFCETAI
jgi:hypothetical protein